MHLGERRVRDEAVIGEDDPGAEATVEDGPPVVGRIVVGQGRTSARLLVVLGEFAQPIEGVDPGFCCAERIGIDVGGIEEGAIIQPFLPEQDG